QVPSAFRCASGEALAAHSLDLTLSPPRDFHSGFNCKGRELRRELLGTKYYLFGREPIVLSGRSAGRLKGIVDVIVRRERRWTTAGATPARELVRSTR